MCARYTMVTPPDELIEEFEATLAAPKLEPHYNIAPTMDAPIVVQAKGGERRLGLARFGLIPHWADDPKIGVRMLNARVETVADKPAYRRAFSKHRCLAVADGFFEWRREGKKKIPYWFRVPERGPFGMAGLWAIWNDPEGHRVSSFTILTEPAEGEVAEIHDRMPIVLPKDAYGAWLDRELTDPEAVREVLRGERGEELFGTQVSTRVNDVRNDDPGCVEPVA